MVAAAKTPDESIATRRRTTTITASDVLWFVPNLIGYARIGLVLTSFVLLTVGPNEWWIWAILCYVGGFVGDLFDGWAARYYHQTSHFGGVLDMVTDRCSTLGFLYLLGLEYSESGLSRLVILMLQLLDVSSHWCQTCATTVALGLHHKSEAGNADKHWLVQCFYRSYAFFGYLCCGAEFTYVLLFVKHRLGTRDDDTGLGFLTVRFVVDSALCVTIPGCILKQVVNVLQLASACHAMARKDAQDINHQNQNRKTE